MHSYLENTRRNQAFSIAILLFALCAHARAGGLSLSGQPQTAVQVGQVYSFQPILAGANELRTSFSIANKPAWLAFDSGTGSLNGVATLANVGSFSGITISATSGKKSVRMPAFTIMVSQPAPTVAPPPPNAAPVIAGVPAIAGSVGRLYSFTPAGSDADGNTLTFSVQNKPAWATFNTATGALSGTPAAAGEYANIAIRVSDGTATASLAPFTLTIAPLVLGSVTLNWTPPTANIDGTPLTDLAGFRVLYGSSPTELNRKLELPGADFTSVRIEDLTAGTYYFAVTAYNSTAIESEVSQMVWKTIL